MNKNLFLTAGLIFCVTVFAAGQSSQDMKEQLNQHYVGKPVMVKVPLPPANAPLLLYPEKEKNTDLALYKLKLEKAGIGLEVGTIAIIKELDIRENEITFHLIGVGEEYPSGNISPELLDEKIWGYGGARVRVKLETPLEQVENPLTLLNNTLSIVVTTKSLVSLENIPAEFREAVKAGVVGRGMNRQMVYLIMGDPSEILREFKDDVLKEAWLYEKEDFTTLMILFSDGRVTQIKEF